MEANLLSLEDTHFTRHERRILLTLGSVYTLRTLGLFMIIPVFALYAKILHDATPATIGIALGIYGFSQALCQLPFGVYSDKYGRRPLLLAGLLVFALGSFVGAITKTIYGLMLARALQGAGAIGSVVMATLSDAVVEKRRVRAMALLGMTIGASFLLAMMLGPLFNIWIGVPGIFWTITLLSSAAIVVVYFTLSEKQEKRAHYITNRTSLKMLFTHQKLRGLNIGVFSLHAILAALFLIIPLKLEQFGVQKSGMFQFYLIIMLLSSSISYGIIFYGEKKEKTQQIFKSAILGLVVVTVILGISLKSLAAFSISLFLFFLVFNVLEALLPALVVKEVPPESKGGALGIYSTSQFLGVFVGGSLGGWLHGHYGMMAVVLLCCIMALFWATWTCQMPKIQAFSKQ